MPTYPHVTLTASEVEVCLPVIQLDSSGWVQAETPVFDPNHCWPPALPRPLARAFSFWFKLVRAWRLLTDLTWSQAQAGRTWTVTQALPLGAFGPAWGRPWTRLRVWSGGSSCLAPQGRSFMTVLPQSHSSDKSQGSFHCQLAWESYSNCQCPEPPSLTWTLFCLYSHLFNLI